MNDAIAPIRLAYQLRQQSQKVRTDSIRAQIISALNICDLLEMKSKWGSIESVRHSMSTLWRHVEVVRRHIHEPDHISPDATEKLLRLLAQLDSRVRHLDESLKASSTVETAFAAGGQRLADRQISVRPKSQRSPSAPRSKAQQLCGIKERSPHV